MMRLASARLVIAAFAAFLAPFATGAAPFTFAVYGDSRADKDCTGNVRHRQIVAKILSLDPAMVFNTGDMIAGFGSNTNYVEDGNCTLDSGPGSLKKLISPLQERAPPAGLATTYFPVIGNHDDNWGSKWYPDPFQGGFCDVFDVKALVPNHTRGRWNRSRRAMLSDAQFYDLACSKSNRSVYPAFIYYSFAYRDAHFLVLRINSDEFDLEACRRCASDQADYDDYYNMHQLDFIVADLAAARANPALKSIFVLLHAPLFGSGPHPNSRSARRLAAVFSKHRVKAVFSGHNHLYERSHPLLADGDSPEGRRDEPGGTVYFTTGGGGAPLHTFREPAPWFSAVRKVAWHYIEVRVDGDRMEVLARDAGGATIDQYSR